MDGHPSSLVDNSFAMTAGRLIHKVYKIEGLGNIWLLDPFSITGLDPLESYYLSAKVSRTALTGQWVLSAEQMGTESEPSYWHFNFGVLSSVIEGERSFKPTKGFTLISGGSIETDVISAYMINVNRLFAQVVTVGSDGYNNAGISGLADGKIYDDNWEVIGVDPNKSVRFWAGSDENDKHKAPFNVLNDGSMRAYKGNIGNFLLGDNFLNGDMKENTVSGIRSMSGDQLEVFSIGRIHHENFDLAPYGTDKAPGLKAGRELALSQLRITEGWGVVMVAGMDHAGWVQAMGRSVLASAYFHLEYDIEYILRNISV